MCSLSTWASDIAVNTAFGHRLEHVAIGERVLKPAWQTLVTCGENGGEELGKGRSPGQRGLGHSDGTGLKPEAKF